MDYDDMPGARAIEDRRWAVLEALATIKATSFRGCCAKARALNTRGVREDLESHEAIGDALAQDLLSLAA